MSMASVEVAKTVLRVDSPADVEGLFEVTDTAVLLTVNEI